jgi:Tfp pilus assembly protein PilN
MSAPVSPATDLEVTAPRRLEGPVRVNLLPESTRQRERLVRQRAGLLVAGLALLAALGGVFWWQSGRIDDARTELSAQQARLADLQAEVDALQQFAQLEQRLADSETMITSALGDEVSLAGVLSDLAVVMPSDAQLDQLTITMSPSTLSTSSEGPSVGSFTAVGKSLRNHAPGVERLLLELDKIVAFHDLFVSSSRLEDPEEPFATFTVESQLGPEAETGRYDRGVPEELR